MAPPFQRRSSRVLLWVWAVVSLGLVVLTGLYWASTVAVPDDHLRDMGPAGGPGVPDRHRLHVEVLPAPDAVVTLAEAAPAAPVFGAEGDVLYFGTALAPRHPGALLPFQNPDGDFGRALAYLVPNATVDGAWDVPAAGLRGITTLNVTDVPTRNATTGELEYRNLTVDLSAYDGPGGFLVKRDASEEPDRALVPFDQVYGRVLRPVPTSSIWQALALAVLGFVAPLLLIIMSHRARSATPGGAAAGPAGAGGPLGPLCPECGRPADPSLDFCTRCGAILRR